VNQLPEAETRRLSAARAQGEHVRPCARLPNKLLIASITGCHFCGSENCRELLAVGFAAGTKSKELADKFAPTVRGSVFRLINQQ